VVTPAVHRALAVADAVQHEDGAAGRALGRDRFGGELADAAAAAAVGRIDDRVRAEFDAAASRKGQKGDQRSSDDRPATGQFPPSGVVAWSTVPCSM
jgi:hypothetical protein